MWKKLSSLPATNLSDGVLEETSTPFLQGKKMAFISAFKGSYFKTETNNLSDLIIPPYDTLDAHTTELYRRKSPYNFAHVDLQLREDDDYAHSLSLLEKWKQSGVIQETSSPCFFLYRQNFSALGRTHQRDTLLCTVGLEDFSKGIIRPHENTFGKYKADRLQLLRKTQYNLSHIFGMVKDPNGFLAEQFEHWSFEKPFLRARSEDGVEHTIWRVEEIKAPEVVSFFSSIHIYIVDGHHRYESALMYAREMGVEGKFEHPASKTTFCIANTFDPGLIIFPTHRLLAKGTHDEFDWSRIEHQYTVTSISLEEAKVFTSHHQKNPSFVIYFQNKFYLLNPRDWTQWSSEVGQSVAKLAVTWSDHRFLKEYFGVNDQNRRETISYEKDFESAWSKKDEKKLIVFHAPPAVSDVTSVADEKKFMPQKSTFFIPKLYGGLIFRNLQGDSQ